MALKLGKGTAFVKSRLRRLPLYSDVWEADFLLQAHRWTGIVVEHQHGAVLAMTALDATPTVNELARLLADAMQRPLFEVAQHRPQIIRMRDNPDWQELLPHLEELRITVVLTKDLSEWDAAAAEYCRLDVGAKDGTFGPHVADA